MYCWEKIFFLGKQLQNSDGNQEVVTIERKITSASEDTSYISNNSNVPRAIRGSGALDKNKPKKDGVNSRLNSCRQNATPNQQKPNKGWDHDDRFHKDYEWISCIDYINIREIFIVANIF